jgi:hypothetical protein
VLLVELAGQRLIAVRARLLGRRPRGDRRECCFETIGIGAEISVAGEQVARDPRVNAAARSSASRRRGS